MSRYNTQVLSNIRMLCRMQNIDEKVLYKSNRFMPEIVSSIDTFGIRLCAQPCSAADLRL